MTGEDMRGDMITRKSTNWDLLLNETIPPHMCANVHLLRSVRKLLTCIDRLACDTGIYYST